MKKVLFLSIMMGLAACTATTKNVGSLVLPTSNRTIDVVQHRSDNRGCAEAVVIQTYDAEGQLIDAKVASGNALHCQVIGAGIQAGGLVGAASVLRPSRTNVRQSQSQEAYSHGGTNSNTNNVTNTVNSGAGGNGGSRGNGGSGGGGNGGNGGHDNNGFGNGGNDGVPGNSGHSDTNR